MCKEFTVTPSYPMVSKDHKENFKKGQMGQNKEHGDFTYSLWESTPCGTCMGDFT